MQKRIWILNVTYVVVLIFSYTKFLHSQTLEYMEAGHSFIRALMGAAVSYNLFQYLLSYIIFIVFTILLILENIDAIIGKTKYKENKRMFKGSRKKSKVYEVANLITAVKVKENHRNIKMYLDEKSCSNEVNINYNTLFCYKDPETGELNEIEVQDKEVYECVELGKTYKSKITIEYDRRQEVIGTHLEILGL